MRGASGRTADLTQVRSTPPTCKRTPHRKDDKRGGRITTHPAELQLRTKKTAGELAHTGPNQQCLLHEPRRRNNLTILNRRRRPRQLCRPQSLLEDDDRPWVPFTRIKPRAAHGHDKGFPRPHHPGPSTSGDGADHNLIPTPARAFNGSPIGSPNGTPTNGVTDGPRPGDPARR
ncbi:hypothetical protein GW17_00027460 [Ensete ventricosum]|nr:hypothetical protein GW17_00027460 [Ensete ventricosum]